MTSVHAFGLTSMILALIACGGSDPVAPPPPPPPPPQFGSIVVSVATAGHDLDPDGYLVSVDHHTARAIGVNDSLTFDSATVGSHSILVTGNAGNCRSDTTGSSVSVAHDVAAHASFQFGCIRTLLHNQIVYESDSNGTSALIAMNADGSDPERITRDANVYLQPAVSYDGRQIAYVTIRNSVGQIWVMNVDGTNARPLPTPRHFDGEPSWSPDGSAIAFRSTLSGPYGDYGRIFVVTMDGAVRQLTPQTTDYTYDDYPSWSPDGSEILFSRNGEGYTINADGTGLHDIGFGCEGGAWSPNGARIACTAWVGANMDVYLLDASGSNPFRLTTNANQDQDARWSPNGSELVFMRAIDGAFKLFRVESDGTGELQLAPSTADQSTPSWAP